MKDQVEVRTLKEGKYVLIDDEPVSSKAFLMQKQENMVQQKQGSMP